MDEKKHGPYQIQITGQLFLLLDKTGGVSYDRPMEQMTFKCTYFEDGRRALLVFLSKDAADKCVQRLADPNIAVVTLDQPWQFVGLLESMQRQGLKTVTLDHLPADAGMTQAKAVEIGDFIQNLRTSFGVTGHVPEVRSTLRKPQA
jgi:hypothetical protein